MAVEDRRGLVQDRGGLVKPRGGLATRTGRAVGQGVRAAGQGVRAANNIVTAPVRLAGSAIKDYVGGLYSGVVGEGQAPPGIGMAQESGAAMPPQGGLQPPMTQPPYGGGQPPAQGQGGLVESGLEAGAPQFNMELAPAEPRLLEGVEPGVASGTYRYDTAGNPEQAAEYGQAIYSDSAYGATPEGFEAGLPRGGRPTGGQGGQAGQVGAGGQAGLGYYDTSQGLSQAEHDELTRIRGQKTQQAEEQARRRAAPPLVIGQGGGHGLFSNAYRDRRNARLTAENTASGIRGFDKKKGYTRASANAQAQMVQGAMNRYDRAGIAEAGIAERGRQADQRYGLGQAQLSEEGRQADQTYGLGVSELRQEAQQGGLDRDSLERREAIGRKPAKREREYYGSDKPSYIDESGIYHPAERPYSGFTGQGASMSGAKDADNRPPPKALKALKEGVNTPFKNGQVWTLKEGKPVRVS